MSEKNNNRMITENYLRILALFTKGFDNDYYIREVHSLLAISPNTAKQIMDDLERRAVLESRPRGKIRVYRLKNSLVAKDYLILAEEYKKISFVEGNEFIAEVASEIAPHINGICAIFGSYAKGKQKKESDLDVFAAGQCDGDKVDGVAKLYGVNVSLKNYPMDVFRAGIGRDFLINEVAKNHIIISGADLFVNAMVEK